MRKKDVLTRILAIAGIVLVWLPLLAPIFFSVIKFSRSGRFLFDYLMPAELFPIELLGGVLLLFAAFKVSSYKKLIGWSFVAAFVLLVGSMGLAEVTGLASGRAEPTGILMTLVLLPIGFFWIALVIMGIGGILLVKVLVKPAITAKEELQAPQG